MREPLPNNGEKLKPIHVRHLQVRNDEIGKRFLQDGQTIESIFGAQDFIAMRFQDRLGHVSESLLIVYKEDSVPERHPIPTQAQAIDVVGTVLRNLSRWRKQNANTSVNVR
jgi:hypothetical protein